MKTTRRVTFNKVVGVNRGRSKKLKRGVDTEASAGIFVYIDFFPRILLVWLRTDDVDLEDAMAKFFHAQPRLRHPSFPVRGLVKKLVKKHKQGPPEKPSKKSSGRCTSLT